MTGLTGCTGITACPVWRIETMSQAETRQSDIFADVQTTPGHLLRRFQQIAVSMFLRECRDLDLTPLQYATLAALSDAPPLDQATLGGMVALDRTTIGVVVRKLAERGLVTRATSTADRRSKLIRITPAGLSVLEAAVPHVAQVQDHLLAPLEEGERTQLVDLMRRVVVAHNDESRAPLRI